MLLLTLGFTHSILPCLQPHPLEPLGLDSADVAAAIPRLNLTVAAEQRVSRHPSSVKGLSHGNLRSAWEIYRSRMDNSCPFISPYFSTQNNVPKDFMFDGTRAKCTKSQSRRCPDHFRRFCGPCPLKKD